MRWVCTCVPAMLLVASSALGQAAPSYSVDRWGVEEGLPNNDIAALTQTRDGYLWIGTWAGAVRFDGVRFTPVLENLPNDHALALLEDRGGDMWIGIGGGGLARWQHGRLDHFGPAQGLGGQNVRGLAEDADGRIWAATENGVSVVDHGRVTTLHMTDGLRDNLITSVTRGADGRIWIVSPAGICGASGLRIRCESSPIARGRPAAVLGDRSGRLWIGTDRGLFAEGADRPSGSTCQPASCIVDGAITALLESRDGAVWIGFGDGSVARLRGSRLERYGPADRLPARGSVTALFEDAEGSIWMSSANGGLVRFKPKRVTVYSTADGLTAAVVGSIVEDAAGTIWAATPCGSIAELRGGRFIPRFTEHTKDACACVLLAARDGSLWIGTRDGGLFRWNGGRMEHFGPQNGLSDVFVCALFEDREGRVWIGTELGGLHIYENGRLSRAYGAADGVATHDLASFAQDRDGRVWIGSNGNGLSVFENGRFRTLPPEQSPPTRNIAGLLVDSRGDLWIGSATHGLFRRRNGKYEPFGVAQGLGDRLVAVLLEDAKSNLWIGTAHGISRLERSRIEQVADLRAASLDPIAVDRGDGMINTEGSGGGFDPSGLRDRDGRLWFSTIDGIAMIDPASFPVNQVEPQVLVERATLAGRVAAAGSDGAVAVPAGTGSIELAYTAFSFLAPDKVRFRYRLRGFDTSWQDVGARRTAFYNRLPPGGYTFEVLAANNDGVWSSTPATMRLVVLPLLWERPAVRGAALGLLLVATGFAVYAVSQRRVRRQVRELERDQALDRERARIARDLHDDLGARLSHIAVMADGAGATDREGRIARAARAAVQTMDELVWAVNGRNDTVESVAFYIAQFAEEHIVAAGLRYRLQMPPALPARAMGADVRRHLFLACKEAVNNAVKHARASEIRVALRVEGDALIVEVADDGRGLSPEAMDPTGNGLKNLRERMDAANGTLTIDSGPDRGTRVVFTTPL